MYVCLCNDVTEKDIEQAVQRGASSLHHLQDELKVATCCGNCADCAQECLDRSLGRWITVLDNAA